MTSGLVRYGAPSNVPRIVGHGPTLYQGGLPSARRLELVSATPLRTGVIAVHDRSALDGLRDPDVPSSGGLSMHTTNYANAFIETAEDCPVDAAVAPPEKDPPTVARMQYERLVDAPYRLTSDDLVFDVHAARAGVPDADRDSARAIFFSKGQPCLRSSPLAKSYAWGFHFDADGRLALVAAGSPEYARFAAADGVTHLRAMRRSRAR